MEDDSCVFQNENAGSIGRSQNSEATNRGSEGISDDSFHLPFLSFYEASYLLPGWKAGHTVLTPLL